jgi:hypothetical protein
LNCRARFSSRFPASSFDVLSATRAPASYLCGSAPNAKHRLLEQRFNLVIVVTDRAGEVCHLRTADVTISRSSIVRWAAYTDSWKFEIHNSVWFSGSDASSHPPKGVLPILLVDDRVIEVQVISASRSEIVIARDGYHWCLTPAIWRSSRRTRFPGTQWIIASRRRNVMPPQLRLIVPAAREAGVARNR